MEWGTHPEEMVAANVDVASASAARTPRIKNSIFSVGGGIGGGGGGVSDNNDGDIGPARDGFDRKGVGTYNDRSNNNNTHYDDPSVDMLSSLATNDTLTR